MIRLKMFSVDVRLDGQRCPLRQTRGSMVGPGRDRGAAVIWSGASARLGRIAGDFIWIFILGTLDSDTRGAIKARNACKTRGSPRSLVQICVFSDQTKGSLSL